MKESIEVISDVGYYKISGKTVGLTKAVDFKFKKNHTAFLGGKIFDWNK